MRRFAPLLLAALLFGCTADPTLDVVGTWAVDLEASAIPGDEPAQKLMAQAALSTVRAEFRKDGTFVLNVMASTKGTWKSDGKHVYLAPEEGPRALLSAAGSSGEVQLDVEKDRLLWTLESPFGKANLVLVRAPAEEERAEQPASGSR